MLTPFLQYVSEARIVRRLNDVQRYTWDDIVERVYVSFLGLSILKHFDQTRGPAQKYITATTIDPRFSKVRFGANDLYNMLAIIFGNKDILKKLRNTRDAEVKRQRLSLDPLMVSKYLLRQDNEYKFLKTLQRNLSPINSKYDKLRRALSDYARLSNRAKMITTTKLLQVSRNMIPGTDIARMVEEFARKQKLELSDVIDTEV